MAERDELHAELSAVLRRADRRELSGSATKDKAQRLASLLTDDDAESRHLLGWLHWHRAQRRRGGQDDLQIAVGMFMLCLLDGYTIADLPEGVLPDLADRLASACLQFLRGALEESDPTLLGPAVDLARLAVQCTPPEHRELGARLLMLAACLDARFTHENEPADLDEAVDIYGTFADDMRSGHPGYGLLLVRLAGALRIRYGLSALRSDLEWRIRAGRDAAGALGQGEPEHDRALDDLADALVTRAGLTGDRTDLDEAVRAVRTAGQANPATLSRLAEALYARYESSADPDDLDESIELHRDLVRRTPEGPLRAMHLSMLGNTLGIRFHRSGSVDDLDEAVRCGRAAADLLLPGMPGRRVVLITLGFALRSRFERTGDPADLDESVHVSRAAVQGMPPDEPERAYLLNGLGGVLLRRYRTFGAVPDLHEALELAEEAVRAAPPGSGMHASCLDLLGSVLRSRFDRTGARADLDEAIRLGRQAVDVGSPEDPVEHAGHLSGLGNSLVSRFELTRGRIDLDEAIDIGRRAVRMVPAHSTRRVEYLNLLGAALLLRFRLGTGRSDLDEGIDVYRECVRTALADDPQYAVFLSNLGIALRYKGELTGDHADLEEAVQVCRAAVLATSAGDPGRTAGLNTLGTALRARFERTGTPADLDEAIQTTREAADAIPADDAQRVTSTINLGNLLAIRFRRGAAAADLDEAVRLLTEVSDMETAPPFERVRAAASGGLLVSETDPGRAAALLESAVLLLPEVAARGLGRQDQQRLIGALAGVASHAAALALADPERPEPERATRALRLLESGRGLLLAQILQTRTDLTELRERHPRLAERFAELVGVLEQPLPEPGGPTTTPGEVRRGEERRRAAADLRALLRDIRSAGFASFARPQTIAELISAGGPVVTLNVSPHRSHALILTAEGVEALLLPDLDPDSLHDRTSAFLRAVGDSTARSAGTRVAAQESIRETLGWLWDTVAGRVLDALGHTAPTDDPPRVWWAPGGLLARLPLHAAGHHTDPADPLHRRHTVMDRVVSSYTPTIGALAHARRRAATGQPGADRSLIVAMPVTPGNPPLPGVAEEAARLRRRLPRPALLTSPAGSEVVARLADCAIAHFACHGWSDPSDPSRSLLLLEDWQDAPLTVAALTPLNLTRARLAYLSACSTAQTGAESLLDESIHLASAFQLAGFPHVIGTLWPIPDRTAADVADTFYAHLTADAGTLDTSRSARALHDTLRALRDEYPLVPSLWSAHIHSGA